MNAQTEEAMAHLRSVFANYRSGEVRAPSPSEVGALLHEAALHGPPGAFLKAILPDAIEVSIGACHPEMPDPQEVLAALPRAGWDNWSSGEREAVQRVCEAWWVELLSVYPAPHEASELLEGIAVAGLPIDHALTRWLDAPPATGALHLADFLDTHFDRLAARGRMEWGSRYPEAQRTIRAWLASDVVDDYLASAVDVHGDRLEATRTQLEWLRAAPAP